jgi:hypothetical protein
MSTLCDQTVPVLKTPVQKETVLELIDKNHKEKDIFFSREKHNHFVHTLLSHYALGADDKRLEREWDIENDREPFLPYREETIDQSNWPTFIGKPRYYPNYLAFFEEEVKKEGALPAMLKYAFTEELYPCLLAGAVHPIIHLGFGLEFDLPSVIAEGLALTCVQGPGLKKLLTRVHKDVGGETGVLKLLDMLYKDSSLDTVITAQTPNKTAAAIDGADEVIKRLIDLWFVPNDPASIAKGLEDLYTGAMYVYAAAAFGPHSYNGDDLADKMEGLSIEPKDVKLDFFILHVLTGALAVRIVVPYLTVDKARLLLKQLLAATLMYYIGRGRPPIRADLLRAYVPSTKEMRALSTWEEVNKLTTTSEDLHVPKVIRALEVGYQMYEKNNEGSHAKDSLWFKAAVLTIDHWLGLPRKGWEYKSIGLKETWSEVATGVQGH